nr:hypothetical protein Iba_chr05fCG2910 [Ipomoea batatas]
MPILLTPMCHLATPLNRHLAAPLSRHSAIPHLCMHTWLTPTHACMVVYINRPHAPGSTTAQPPHTTHTPWAWPTLIYSITRENNSRTPTFRSTRTVHIFGAAITVPYNGGSRRRLHPRQPRTNQNADIPVGPPNPTGTVQLIDFFANDISRNSAVHSPSDGGGSSSNPVGLANATGGFFRFETGPPPQRDFLRIGDGDRQPVAPPRFHRHHNFDADNLRAQVATFLMQILATLQQALGGNVEFLSVVDALAELVETMVQALEATQTCPICRGA